MSRIDFYKKGTKKCSSQAEVKRNDHMSHLLKETKANRCLVAPSSAL